MPEKQSAFRGSWAWEAAVCRTSVAEDVDRGWMGLDERRAAVMSGKKQVHGLKEHHIPERVM